MSKTQSSAGLGKSLPMHLKNTHTVFQKKEAKQRQRASLVSPILKLLGGNYNILIMGCQRTSTNSCNSLGKIRQKKQISQTRGQEQHLPYTQLSLQEEDERKDEKQFKTSNQAMLFLGRVYTHDHQ